MIRCGFFNSVNNDRTYDAEDMGKIFEGIISDGVFNNINSGNSFKVTKNNNTMTVNVAAGKAWFYNKYFEIVGTEPVTLRNGDVNPRWDAICIKLDNSSSVREGSLYVYEGEPNAEPVKPTVTSTDDIKLIPIAYIKILASAVNVNNAVITSTIGTRLCPYSETTLDPRRAMYAFEGETAEAGISLYSVKTYDFNLDLDQNIFNSATEVIGRYGSKIISKETLELDSLENVEIIGQIKSANSNIITSGHMMITPLVITKNVSNIVVKAKCMAGQDRSGTIDSVNIDCHLIMIVKEEI